MNIYPQIKIQDSNKCKTNFKSHYNHFKYEIISFGLTDILAMFQSYINKILAKKLDVFIILYFDTFLSIPKVKEKSMWKPFDKY